MQLVSPSPGVCADRHTILHLKIRAACSRGIPETHLVEECNAIEEYLEHHYFSKYPSATADYDLLYQDMARVNAQLWDLEDEQRQALEEWERSGMRGASRELLVSAGGRSFKITKLNNRRAHLVEDISALFGVPRLVEKMHKGQSA